MLDELEEWKQAAGCEAGLRREFANLAHHYRTALLSIANSTCCEGCQEAAKVARAALDKIPASS